MKCNSIYELLDELREWEAHYRKWAGDREDKELANLSEKKAALLSEARQKIQRIVVEGIKL